jgi:hypothetical protein
MHWSRGMARQSALLARAHETQQRACAGGLEFELSGPVTQSYQIRSLTFAPIKLSNYCWGYRPIVCPLYMLGDWSTDCGRSISTGVGRTTSSLFRNLGSRSSIGGSRYISPHTLLYNSSNNMMTRPLSSSSGDDATIHSINFWTAFLVTAYYLNCGQTVLLSVVHTFVTICLQNALSAAQTNATLLKRSFHSVGTFHRGNQTLNCEAVAFGGLWHWLTL